MNGSALPVPHGGPLRMRLPRQIGYKNLKFVTKLTVVDDEGLKKIGNGCGAAACQFGYAWYTGI
jgi:DMSO/TMAO reductase YedYZ molybdopterin-dependent catalytic subunit